MEKGYIISLVYDEICEQAGIGGFIKKDEHGRWYDVGEFLAREKVSQAFRDALQDKYKSSTASKRKRREMLAQCAELKLSQQRSSSSSSSNAIMLEPTLDDLESAAIQNMKQNNPAGQQLLHLLDQDIKHVFASSSSSSPSAQQQQQQQGEDEPLEDWCGSSYNNRSFRGVEEMPLLAQEDRRQEMLATYNRRQSTAFLNR